MEDMKTLSTRQCERSMLITAERDGDFGLRRQLTVPFRIQVVVHAGTPATEK